MLSCFLTKQSFYELENYLYSFYFVRFPRKWLGAVCEIVYINAYTNLPTELAAALF